MPNMMVHHYWAFMTKPLHNQQIRIFDICARDKWRDRWRDNCEVTLCFPAQCHHCVHQQLKRQRDVSAAPSAVSRHWSRTQQPNCPLTPHQPLNQHHVLGYSYSTKAAQLAAAKTRAQCVNSSKDLLQPRILFALKVPKVKHNYLYHHNSSLIAHHNGIDRYWLSHCCSVSSHDNARPARKDAAVFSVTSQQKHLCHQIT